MSHSSKWVLVNDKSNVRIIILASEIRFHLLTRKQNYKAPQKQAAYIAINNKCKKTV